MDKKRKVILSICVLLIIAGGFFAYIMSNSGEKVKSFKQIYFEMVEDDISGEKLTSKKIIKDIDKIFSKDKTYTRSTAEDEGSEYHPPTITYGFENKNEILAISFSKNDNSKEESVDFISYQLKKEMLIPYMEIGYVKQKEGPSSLATIVSPDSLDEQKKVFDIMKKGKEVNEIYHTYYKLAPYVADSKSITIEEMESILGVKATDIERSTNSEPTTSYVIEKDNYIFTILYNKEENKAYFASVESLNSLKDVSVYCSENQTDNTANTIVTSSADLEAQKILLNDLLESR